MSNSKEMRTITGKDALPEPIAVSLWALESLERRIAQLREAAAEHRKRIYKWMVSHNVKSIVTSWAVCWLAKNTPSRSFNYARMHKEYPQEYDWLVEQGFIRTSEPSEPYRLVFKLQKQKGAEDTE